MTDKPFFLPGRWGRAVRWLPSDSHRVLDLGCAFGFGTRRLAQHTDFVIGLDRSEKFIKQGKRNWPAGRFILGSAERAPLPDHCLDAVVLLDVLEHTLDERPVLAEIERLLRPGGTLLLSVPHKGFLAGCDSLNVYQAMRQRRPDLPLPPNLEIGAPIHRHYSVAQVQKLLGPGYTLDCLARTGLGLAELVNLVLLVVCLRVLRSVALYERLQVLYFGMYVLEDTAPLGSGGYHLMLRARKHS